jgi:hypothetical protein
MGPGGAGPRPKPSDPCRLAATALGTRCQRCPQQLLNGHGGDDVTVRHRHSPSTSPAVGRAAAEGDLQGC